MLTIWLLIYPPSTNGTGACRQFGRWLTISGINLIRAKLTQVIAEACNGAIGNRLIVHIISGISGGMGSGSFVDVCYIAQDILKGLGFTAAKIFGYFVLPDVINSKPGCLSDPIRRTVNERNGLASLLEIEHLMNLRDSNEWFEQDYGDFRIRTQEKLVDMCHFVSSTNNNGVPVPNGYEYALNVIGDYILAFMSEEMVAAGAIPITMTGILASISAELAMINPEHGCGYSQNYHIIGSVTAEIPITQMATYLASELFTKLTIVRKLPDNIEIEKEFAEYLKLSDSRIKQLENQLGQEAPWIQITPELVRGYFDQIKSHMNDNVLPAGMIMQTEESLRRRRGLLMEKRETLTKDVTAYVYQAGAGSIPGLALNKLIEMATDPDKGPIYAYGMMNKTGADIFHYLGGRMKTYSHLKWDARDQEAFFTDREPNVKRELGRAGIFNRSAKIEAYAAALNNIYYWQAQGDLYEQMEIMMAELIEILRKMNDEYLKPLYYVTKELIETFEVNASYFDMGKGDESQDGFTRQLVKFSRIKPDLDAAIKGLNPEAETRGLLDLLVTEPEIWMERKEARLKAKISEYILTKFTPILSGSLESFLRKDLNMNAATPAGIFAGAIKQRIIEPLADQAAPIFWTSEPLVEDDTRTSHRTVLTLPGSANHVYQAAVAFAAGDPRILRRNTLINDRIYIIRTISGVPMHAYRGLIEYLRVYQNNNEGGLHLYEGDVDWRKILTFPCPYSYCPQYTKNAEDLLALYDEAEQKGIIYYNGLTAYVKRLGYVDLDRMASAYVMTDGKVDIAKADEMIAELEAAKNNTSSPLMINSKGNIPGNSLVKDNFLRFYGLQQVVRSELKKLDDIEKLIMEIKAAKED